jgi:hypothetical protein
LKQLLKIILLVLPFLVSTFTSQAQISRLKGGNSVQDESSSAESPTQKAEADKSASSPDTAKCSYFTSNAQAAYTLQPFRAPLHRFDNYNSLQKNPEMYAFLGNPGSAANPITYLLKVSPGFVFMHGAFDLYKLQQDSIHYLVQEKPFSEINYTMGKAKEQQLLFTHSQQIRKGLTLGFFARFANSPGLYQRQRTYYSSGYFTARYNIPSNRYGVMASFLIDRFRNYENGGITYDSVFKENTENDRKTIIVNLSNAMNRDKSSGFFMQQYFNFQKQEIRKKDSTGSVRQSQRFNAGRIIYSLKYYRSTTAYEDDKSKNGYSFGFYPLIYGDSTKTLDSTFHIHIENTFVYSNIEPDTAERNFPFQYAFGISQQHDKLGYGFVSNMVNKLVPPSAFSPNEIVSLREDSRYFNQLIPFGTLKGVIKKTYFIANGRISLGGYNKGDHELSGSFYQFFNILHKSSKIYITASKGQVHPDYIYQYFISDHFRWDNNFKVQDYINGTIGLDVLGLNLSLGITRITNFVWLNSAALPQQADGGLAISRADASKIFRPGKWIIDTRITFQNVSRDSLLQLPSFAGRASLSYNMFLFKKVLHAQIGLGCQYYSSYYADAYHPELRMFYRQNEELTGNYPYADVFLNMRIKRARIFIKYQHFNAGWLDHNYYMVPHYPGADATLKAGVSWIFYD